MINLSVSDEFDGLDKIDDLRNAINTKCQNTDALLLSVSEDGNRCTVQRIVGGESKIVNEPSWLTWNKMFF